MASLPGQSVPVPLAAARKSTPEKLCKQEGTESRYYKFCQVTNTAFADNEKKNIEGSSHIFLTYILTFLLPSTQQQGSFFLNVLYSGF